MSNTLTVGVAGLGHGRTLLGANTLDDLPVEEVTAALGPVGGPRASA